MTKKLVCVLISIITLLTLCSFSEERPIDDLDYVYTNFCYSSLYISGSNGECVSHLTGYSGVTTKIKVEQHLQVRDGNRWRNTQNWTKTYYTYHAHFVNNRTLYFGNTYRVYTTFTVYSGSNYETISTYSNAYSV